jgi:hypothetical protein
MNVRERMGSGGLQRLQISVSGTSCVRGGFDSHAFPPLLQSLVLAAALLGVPAAAAAQAPQLAAGARDTLTQAQLPPAGVRDTLARARPDTLGRAAARARRRANPLGEQPRVVMLRSLVVPGWGQFHNHAWFKAAAVAGTEGWLISSILRDRGTLDGLRRDVDAAFARNDEAAYIAAANSYNSKLDAYVGGQWLLGGLLTYALVDAYVDAHFRRFEIEFRTDPALPRDVAPEDARGAPGRGSRSRLSLRWHF